MKESIIRHLARSRQANWTSWSIGLIALLFECQMAAAAPLDLDPTCNGTGKVMTGIQADPQFPVESATSVALQQDGKIIAAGSAYNGDQKGYDFALVRYTPDCGIDPAFGTDGRVLTDFASTDDTAVGVAVQSDNKIIVAGTVSDASGLDFALARYNPDGTLDPSFGSGGLVRIDLGAAEFASSVALQQDGKIVVAGQQEPVDLDASNFLIARYLSNGTLDAGFGDAGKVVTDFGAWDIAWAVAIQQDGKIVAVGSSWDAADFLPSYGALARYNANGTLDTSFNRGASPAFCVVLKSCGKFRVDLGLNYYEYPVSVALRAANGTEDGKIVVAGQFGVARFKPNGSFDTDFGTNGIMDNPDNTGNAVAIVENGRIVVAGQAAGDFAVAMYEPTGKVCSDATTDFSGYFEEAFAITIQSDGKIVVAGYGEPSASADWDFALARYQGGNCPIRLATLGYYAAYHFFVHPQDLVGPPVDPSGPLQVGRAEHLAVPASAGKAFAGRKQPGYEAFKLTNAAAKHSGKGLTVAVTDTFGDSVLERFEQQQLLVPTDIAAGRIGGVTVSGSRSAPLLKCYRVTTQSGDKAPAPGERKSFIVTDALKRSWTFEIGEPKSLCKPVDRRGRELTGKVPSLLGYQVKVIETAGPSRGPLRLPTANEFGARMLHVGQPELLFVPALTE
jgi:uncharacterized delta-60 repeat protein